ncbi:hypothetical protein NPIL_400391 [Nephila pilipes]|uniref:Uncharacterized protein n=1 Tax=Nephila pilipes TaxID=299642 RepID=A0A8X6TB60_NEPPI|nr:hypothetical protein NPIL_400391 [Nephila pilipes]
MPHEKNQKLDYDIQKAMGDSDLRQTIVELSLKFGCPWFAVQDHLHRIGQLYRIIVFFLVRRILQEVRLELLSPPQCSPDLAPSD